MVEDCLVEVVCVSLSRVRACGLDSAATRASVSEFPDVKAEKGRTSKLVTGQNSSHLP